MAAFEAAENGGTMSMMEDTPNPEPEAAEPALEIEVLDALPVASRAESVQLRRAAPLAAPLIQTAAAAATGFVAGALTLALLRRSDARRLLREPRPALAPGQVYYVRVRLIHGDRGPAGG
jgi:hypothetical protein